MIELTDLILPVVVGFIIGCGISYAAWYYITK